MRKIQKDSIIEIANLLQKAQMHIKNLLKQQEYASALDLLQQCQQGAIQIGTVIEQSEGEGVPIVRKLEEYCELVFRVFETIQNNAVADADIFLNEMDGLLAEVTDSICKNIIVRKEVVFLPYKASMWDSLESIWMAADADPECDAYVVPIPYYEKDAEGNLKEYHYEGDDFPEYVKITHYSDYPLEEIRPEAIFIHNPYDHCNYVTSVHPRFYSYELKKYTDMLVYVPYYASSGGMSDGQALCSAYRYVDYMVTQSEEFKNYIDETIPREKILPFGSPKYDKVLRICGEVPLPPLHWKEKTKGRKIYFFNTSISGMLSDTRSFLMKMEYVFKCFRDRDDACLLWRPHPLLESTFDSMRKEYRPVYDSLKRYFFSEKIGIYDDTPDIESTIALCDAYIGDAGSSVISLFGIVGKPIFILDNTIHNMPKEDDWKKEALSGFAENGSQRWHVTQGNKLYASIRGDYNFAYACDLSEYAYGDYYQKAVELGQKVIVCPKNAQDILIVKEQTVIRKIELKKRVQRQGAFASVLCAGHYLFLIPHRYPAIVRFDVYTEQVDYLEGYNEIFVQNKNGQSRTGGSCIWNDYLLVASPIDDRVLAIHIETMQVQVLAAGGEKEAGCMAMVPDKKYIWMLPVEGKTVKRWNPMEGSIREYKNVPEGFACRHLMAGYECNLRPYSSATVTDEAILLAPYWGNMLVELKKETGEVSEWKTMPAMTSAEEYGKVKVPYAGKFVAKTGAHKCLYFNELNKKMYEFDLRSCQGTEVDIIYNKKEWENHEPGFSKCSQWLRYCAIEKATYSLPDFLEGKQCGNVFDKEEQIEAFRAVAAGGDGRTGERIYHFVMDKCSCVDSGSVVC